MLTICISQRLRTYATRSLPQGLWIFLNLWIFHKPNIQRTRASLLIKYSIYIQSMCWSETTYVCNQYIRYMQTVYMLSICVGRRLRTSATRSLGLWIFHKPNLQQIRATRSYESIYVWYMCWSETTYVYNQVPRDAGSVSPVTKMRQLCNSYTDINIFPFCRKNIF